MCQSCLKGNNHFLPTWVLQRWGLEITIRGGGGHFEGTSLGFSHQFLHQIIPKSGIFYTSKEKRNKTVVRSIKDLSCLQLVSLQIYRVN